MALSRFAGDAALAEDGTDNRQTSHLSIQILRFTKDKTVVFWTLTQDLSGEFVYRNKVLAT